MSENGYVRKIDELGRIVIPKELRQRLKIQDGENLIINCSDKKINLSRYSYIGNNVEFIKKIGDRINFLLNFDVIISDLENIIYCSKNYSNTKLNKSLISYINNRESDHLTELEVNEDIKIKGDIYIEPIISNSIGIGIVIIHSDKKQDFADKICKLTTEIISNHINIS